MTARVAGDDCVADATAVRIRRMRREDAIDDFHWRRDPDLIRLNAAFPLAAGFAEFLVQIENAIRFTAADRAQFAIEDAEGAHIGTVMFYHADGDRDSAEFGIVIGPEAYRGRGLGTAATVAFLRFLWQSYPFRRIYLHALEWNVAARASFTKAGFSETARVLRGTDALIRMEVRREWWLLWDAEGRFPDPTQDSGPKGGDSQDS